MDVKSGLPQREYRVVRLLGNGYDPGPYGLSEEAQTFAVVLCFPQHPGWWRVVAYFHNEQRAIRYCCVENDCLDEEDVDGDSGDVEPKDAAPEPPSRLISPKEATADALRPVVVAEIKLPEAVALPELKVPVAAPAPVAEATNPEIEEPSASEAGPTVPTSEFVGYIPWAEQDDLLRQMVIDD